MLTGAASEMDLKHYRQEYVSQALKTVLHIHENCPSGDILVFLTGSAEINDFTARLEDRLRETHSSRAALILPLYGALDTDQQRNVFRPTPRGSRKIVACTNIAATSVTVDGVRYVVDAGLVKQNEFDAATNMEALLVTPISRAAAEQRCAPLGRSSGLKRRSFLVRAGRAGRTAPGECYRLYSREFYDQMPAETVPEIKRTSLASTVLSLKQLGIDDVLAFDFMERPDESLLIAALQVPPARQKRSLYIQLFQFCSISFCSGRSTRPGRSRPSARRSPRFPWLPPSHGRSSPRPRAQRRWPRSPRSCPLKMYLSIHGRAARPRTPRELTRPLPT